MKVLLVLNSVINASSVELLFREDYHEEIHRFFAEELPKKGITSYLSPLFLEAFFSFLVDREPSACELNILDALWDINHDANDFFLGEIDGLSGVDCTWDGIIIVDNINTTIYDSVDDVTWRCYANSNAYIVFLAILLVCGEQDHVKRKLIESELLTLKEWKQFQTQIKN